MEANDRRLIEDVLPIAAINEVAQREKIGHAATHPRKLHLWWARRPLAAARAAVYAALVPAAGRSRTLEDEARFFNALCRWGGPQQTIDRARAEVLAANDGGPPKILDMFAGGGAIPLEAARLGCEATAVELNPVAHLIERATLEFPQRFPGLADDIRHWGKIWVDRTWEQLADLYPPVGAAAGQQQFSSGPAAEGRRPLAYLWTRTVRCPNPVLAEHQVPLVRQTWLARKKGRYIALRTVVDRPTLSVRYEVIEAATAEGVGFDPSAGSSRGQATCPVCGAMVTIEYVKAEGRSGRLQNAPLAAVVLKVSGRGRDYMPAGSYPLPDDLECERRLAELDVAPPDEALVEDYTQAIIVPKYGLKRFRDLFTPRQLLTLCTLTAEVRQLENEMSRAGVESSRIAAITTYLGLIVSRLADYHTVLCRWHTPDEKMLNTFARQALPMVWDFAENNPYGGASGDASRYVEFVAEIVETLAPLDVATCYRASATSLPLNGESQDAVITDPPYYDNISYADLSDFFYVWLKRSVGFLYPDDFGGELTPKRAEAVSVSHRHGGNKTEARKYYESLMAKSFAEAHRVLKPGAPLVCIYAHKTTLGWSSLVDALRRAGFMLTEAWPLDTEMPERTRGQNSAALASSIFLIARKRQVSPSSEVGFEGEVLSELDSIIRERLDRLEKAGISGSDLVIATVGAGLRPFTRYERVEQENGEELPAERFLVLVQNRVLDAIFGGLAGADPATRFYVAGQFSYGYAFVPFAEANNLAYMTGVELDGPRGLTAGHNPLAAKKGSTIALRDFEQRGDDVELGIPRDLASGRPPTIDVAHGVLWRAEYRSRELKDYLADARPDVDLLRTVIQALAGKALRSGSSNGKAPEAAAAERLLVSWRRLIDDNLFS